MTDEQNTAVREYEAARKEMQKALVTNNGGKKAEALYGAAYQKLVQLGLAPQIKQRYRP